MVESDWVEKNTPYFNEPKPNNTTIQSWGKVQGTSMMLDVCFYLTSLYSSPKVFDDYTHYLPTHHQSFSNVGLCLVLFCKPQLTASTLYLYALTGVEAITFCKSGIAFTQWSKSLFECQNFIWYLLPSYNLSMAQWTCITISYLVHAWW